MTYYSITPDRKILMTSKKSDLKWHKHYDILCNHYGLNISYIIHVLKQQFFKHVSK